MQSRIYGGFEILQPLSALNYNKTLGRVIIFEIILVFEEKIVKYLPLSM